MPIIVTCGHEASGYLLAHSALKLAGLSEANSFRDGKFTPAELTKRICQAHKVGKSRDPYRQLAPSKVWQALSVDMVLANLEEDDWGWADAKNIYLLDHWRDFDPRFKFVLAYSSPEYALASLLEQGKSEPKEIEEGLRKWRAYNEELLRFYSSNAEHAILVNVDTLLENPSEFLTACRDRFEIDLRRTNMPLQPEETVSAMALWSASSLLKGRPDLQSLFEELESAADMPREPTTGPETLMENAWTQYRDLTARFEGASLELAALQAELAVRSEESSKFGKRERDLQQQVAALENEIMQLRAAAAKAEVSAAGAAKENELLILQLHQVQEDLEQTFLSVRQKDEALQSADRQRDGEINKYRLLQGDHKALQQALEDLKARNSKLEAAASSGIEVEQARKENELLHLQLHQVQEELEHYFMKYQALQKPQEPAPVEPTQGSGATTERKPADTILDMRNFFDGHNWHNAEDDGRWAGPETRSTLRLPKLAQGRYKLEFDIVDAIAPEIVRGMQVRANGASTRLKLETVGRIDGPLGSLKRAYVTYVKGGQIYPVKLSGSIEIDEKAALSPLLLELIFPKTISPASRGEPDPRDLAIRLRQVKLSAS